MGLLAHLAAQYVPMAWSTALILLHPGAGLAGLSIKYVAGLAVVVVFCLMLRVYTGGIFGYLLRYAVYIAIYWGIVHYQPFMGMFPPSEPLALPMGIVPASRKMVEVLQSGAYPGYVIAGVIVVGLWLPVTIVGWILRRRRLAGRADFAYAAAPAEAGAAAGTPGQPFEVQRREGEKKQTMVIMMTDIKGYSARMEKDEAATFTLLKEHNVIMRRAITTNRGREIKTIGDAFMVVFTGPIDAVRCGMAMQKGLHDFNKPRAVNDHLLVRIGIHQGEVIVTPKDVFGEGVNIAARMESITDPGGISISKDIYEAIKGKIEAGFQSVGIPKMKNIANPPEVYKIHIAHS